MRFIERLELLRSPHDSRCPRLYQEVFVSNAPENVCNCGADYRNEILDQIQRELSTLNECVDWGDSQVAVKLRGKLSLQDALDSARKLDDN